MMTLSQLVYIVVLTIVLPLTMKLQALSYPHPTLTPIEGKPTALTLRGLRREIYANARNIPSVANGNRGLHGAIMPPAEYQNLPGVNAPFVVPPAPGNPPLNAANIQELLVNQQAYNESKEVYSTYIQMGIDLKKQILEAVETLCSVCCMPV